MYRLSYTSTKLLPLRNSIQKLTKQMPLNHDNIYVHNIYRYMLSISVSDALNTCCCSGTTFSFEPGFIFQKFSAHSIFYLTFHFYMLINVRANNSNITIITSIYIYAYAYFLFQHILID